MFVTMLYSAGLPLLVPLAAAAMFVTYWVDKFLFCRFYSTPPLVRAQDLASPLWLLAGGGTVVLRERQCTLSSCSL